MNKHLKLLFIFLAFVLVSVPYSTFAQGGKSTTKKVTPDTYLPQKSDNPSQHDPHKEENPYKKSTSKEVRDDYCKTLEKRNEITKNILFNYGENRTEEISQLFILISNVPISQSKNEDYNNTQFCSNYGEKFENASSTLGLINYKNYEAIFDKSFGENDPDKIKENATFLFEMGSVIGKNERDILTKSKNTYLLVPDGAIKCVFNKKNNKLYYQNGNHFIEQPSSFEKHLQTEEALNRKMSFEKNLVISFVNDSKTEAKLQEKFKNNYIKIDNAEKFNNLEKTLVEHKYDRVIMVGHIKDNSFTSNTNNGFNFNLPISQINELQTKNNLSLYTLGCNSITNGSNVGFSNEVNSALVADAISLATTKETFTDFFDALSIGENKCFVNVEIVENQIRFEANLEQVYKERQKNTEEVIQKLNKKNEITKVIVYSRLIDSGTCELDSKSNHEAFLDIFFRVVGVILLMVIMLWILIKIIMKLF